MTSDEQIQDRHIVPEHRSYFRGATGALLGSLLGAAIWVLVSYLGYYASMVGLLMAFLTIAGYRLLRGKEQGGMPWIVLGAVILGLFTANIAVIAMQLMLNPNLGLSLSEVLYYAPQAFYNTDLFNVSAVWMNVVIGLFFALVGSFQLISNLFLQFKEAKSKANV